MNINSARLFRQWIKDDEERPDVDVNFMGNKVSINGKKIKGFFNLFHGIKPDISGELVSFLDMAQDNQAVYEFLQNADDCGATNFWVFYNEDYFLAINNGSKFTREGIMSILNIGQSDKHDSNSIGRLGIGFKLVHRLVGKGNGIYELLNENKGPIIFSWNSANQLKSFVSGSEMLPDIYRDTNPYLFKIAITNFPADVSECVYDINYEKRVVFSQEECKEMQDYSRACILETLEENEELFSTGSLFFIKLGEGKKGLIDYDIDSLKNGVAYSINTLHCLKNAYFNGEQIVTKKMIFSGNNGVIAKDSELFNSIKSELRYPDYDINYFFGFLPLDFYIDDYIDDVKALRQSPNIYKFFPMGEEVNGLGLFIHCDCFDNESNRRALHSGIVNVTILGEVAKTIESRLDYYYKINKNQFLQLYASILLSSDNYPDGKKWFKEAFYDKLLNSIANRVPVKRNGQTRLATKDVVIRNFNLYIPLEMIGLDNYEWFEWYGKKHDEIIIAAKDKLGLECWTINDLVANADINKLNDWLKKCTDAQFELFIKELKSVGQLSGKVKALLPNLCLFAFQDGRMSLQEVQASANHIIQRSPIARLRDLLTRNGIVMSQKHLNIHPLCDHITPLLSSNEEYLRKIGAVLEENWTPNMICRYEVVNLINIFTDNIPVEKSVIQELKIFTSQKGTQMCLSDLMPWHKCNFSWESPYTINNNLGISLDMFVPVQDFFKTILVNHCHFKDILVPRQLPTFFNNYKDNPLWTSDFTQQLIAEYGANIYTIPIIEEKFDVDAVGAFVQSLGEILLESNQEYSTDSFYYRCIKLAARTENDSIINHLRNRITIDDVKLTEYTSSNDVVFSWKDKEQKQHTYHLELYEILPDNSQAKIFSDVANKFRGIKDVKSVFCAPKSEIQNISNLLYRYLNTIDAHVTPAQYAFIILLSMSKNISNIEDRYRILIRIDNDEQLISILEFFMNKGWEEMLFSYMLKADKEKTISICNLYDTILFSEGLISNNEFTNKALEDWCGTDNTKKEFLLSLGVRFEDSPEIQLRNNFLQDKECEWNKDYDVSAFLSWISSFGPFTGSNQISLISYLSSNYNGHLKVEYCKNDYPDAIEWDSFRYIAWKEESDITIFINNTAIKAHIKLKEEDVELCIDNSPLYHFFDDNGKKELYVKGESGIDLSEALLAFAKENIYFDNDDYTALMLNSYEEQRQQEIEIERLKIKIKELENSSNESESEQNTDDSRSRYDEYQREYSDKVKEFMGCSFTMPSNEKVAKHIIARYRILMYLKGLGPEYTFKEGFNEQEYIRTAGYAKIPLASGKTVNPQGAGYGIWHLSPNVWEDIIERNNYACLCTGMGEGDFKLIKNENDIKEIAEKTHNVFIRLTATKEIDIFETIKSIYSPNTLVSEDDFCSIKQIYTNRDVHLMLRVHPTPEPVLNSMFDTVFRSEGVGGFNFTDDEY